jgi:hypothetical protein
VTLGLPARLRRVRAYMSAGYSLAAALEQAGVTQDDYNAALLVERAEPKRAWSKRPTYTQGVAWLAEHCESVSPDRMSKQRAVRLLAALYGRTPAEVASAVYLLRKATP